METTDTHEDTSGSLRRISVPAALDLATHIAAYTDYADRTPGFVTRREVPHAEGVMIVNLGQAIAVTGGNGETIHLGAGDGFIAGAHLRPAFSHSAGAQDGIQVALPLATLRLLTGVPMDQLTDMVVPLDICFGRDATRHLAQRLGEARDTASRVAVFNAAFRHRLSGCPGLDRRQIAALSLLRRSPERDISEIAHAVGWSRKHLAARIRDAVGVGPRCFRRLLRFQRLIGSLPRHGPVRWAALAIDAGYCDQAHMSREFREFAGMTPGEYLRHLLPDGGGLVEV